MGELVADPAVPLQAWRAGRAARDDAVAAGGDVPRTVRSLRIYLDRYPQGAHAERPASFSTRSRSRRSTPATSSPCATCPRDDERPAVARGPALGSGAPAARSAAGRPLSGPVPGRSARGRGAEASGRCCADGGTADNVAGPALPAARHASARRDRQHAGVPFAELAQHADRAIEACRKAAELQPELPHYTALLARAHERRRPDARRRSSSTAMPPSAAMSGRWSASA